MPVKIKKSKKKSGGWDIYEVETGKIVAHSDTKRKAISAMIHRNNAHKRKMKGKK